MNCGGYREIVAADVDGILDSEERLAASEHVATCPPCADLRRAQAEVRAQLRNRPAVVMPAHLRERVLAALEQERHAAEEPGAAERGNVVPLVSRRRVLLVGAIAATLALLLVPGRRGPQPDLFALLVHDAQAAEFGTLEFDALSASVDDLRAHFESLGLPFRDTVPDLARRGYAPVGSRHDTVADVPSAVTVYEGRGRKVVCRRFPLGAVELPEGGEEIGGAIVVTRDGVTMRFVRDGDALCCLASTMPREDFLREMGLAG